MEIVICRIFAKENNYVKHTQQQWCGLISRAVKIVGTLRSLLISNCADSVVCPDLLLIGGEVKKSILWFVVP